MFHTPRLNFVLSDHSPASYDTHGVFSSPRALYMFRSFGHERSSILDGGLPGWQAHGGQTESGSPEDVAPAEYPPPTLKQDVVKGLWPFRAERYTGLTQKSDYNQVSANAELDPSNDSNAFYVLDARPKGRYVMLGSWKLTRIEHPFTASLESIRSRALVCLQVICPTPCLSPSTSLWKIIRSRNTSLPS